MSCHRSALILAFSVCFGSGCQRETADTRAQDERAIREADAATLKAAQAKDVDGAVANYAEDGSWLPPNAPMVNGKAAIRAGWEKLIGSLVSDPWKRGKIGQRQEGRINFLDQFAMFFGLGFHGLPFQIVLEGLPVRGRRLAARML